VRLDGLPLAIELAAARVKVLSPRALLERLQDATGTLPLQVLRGGPGDLPVRHQTLRATIGWSLDLLDADERAIFRRMGTFSGGMVADAAEAVAWPVFDRDRLHAERGLPPDFLDVLTSLLNKGLVLVQQPDGSDEPRFSMLQTIRAFALERLEAAVELEESRGRHAAWFQALALQAEQELTGPRQAEWLDRLEREHDNLRTALTWLERQEDQEGQLRMAAALWRFWYQRGHVTEGRRWRDARRYPSKYEPTPATAPATWRTVGAITRARRRCTWSAWGCGARLAIHQEWRRRWETLATWPRTRASIRGHGRSTTSA
jgi:predicted ATPase